MTIVNVISVKSNIAVMQMATERNWRKMMVVSRKTRYTFVAVAWRAIKTFRNRTLLAEACRASAFLQKTRDRKQIRFMRTLWQ